LYLILAFAALVEVAPVVFYGRLLALGDNCLLVDGGGLQAHVHKGDVGGETAAYNLRGEMMHEKVEEVLHCLSFSEGQITKISTYAKEKLSKAVNYKTVMLKSKYSEFNSVASKIEKLEEKMINGRLEMEQPDYFLTNSYSYTLHALRTQSVYPRRPVHKHCLLYSWFNPWIVIPPICD
jgi:hypothetical protein